VIIAVLAIVAGIVAVGVAADHFVLGAARLARLLGVPAVVVGVVLVGFGTSLPEILVSGLAAGEGEAAAALGNVVGSNIANISLLLGIAALLSPMAVPVSIVRR
jgi:cation:H+ antiporter